MLTVNKNLRPGGRFTISNIAPAAPGKCVVCGSVGGDGRKFVDFGFDIDFYGTVYFCSVCLVECCNCIGWISEQQWHALNESNEQLITRVQHLETDNAHLRNGLNALKLVGDFSRDDYNNLTDDQQNAEKLRQPDNVNEPVIESERSNDTELIEQTNEPGYQDVPDSIKSNSGNDDTTADSGFSLNLQ
jgi:hypothetical protein